MTGNNKHNYTIKDFQRYHAGEMSMQERQALEKAALNDPFLSDALDGYANTVHAEEDIAHLNEKLSNRTKQKRSFSFLRIAALLIIMAGAGWGIYTLSNGNEKQIALDKENIETIDTGIAPASSPVADTTEIITSAIANDANENAGSNVQEEKLSDKPDIASTKAPPAPARSKSRKQTLADTVMAADAEPIPAMETVVVEAPVSRRKAEMRGSVTEDKQNIFRGRLVNKNGRPIPNASVVTIHKQATTTDDNGIFSLPVKDSNIIAIASAVGYETNRFSIKNSGGETNIIMNETNAQLEEVVVTGYSKNRNSEFVEEKTSSAKVATGRPVPLNGWDRYNEYVMQNMHAPLNDKGKIKGRVRLSFTINASGEPTDIKVARSLCSPCDAEAIRLLKQGPKWKTGQPRQGIVEIRF